MRKIIFQNLKLRYLGNPGLQKNLVIMLGLLIFTQCADKKNMDYQIEAVKTELSHIIDGNLDEPVWQQAKAVMLVENRSGNIVTDSRIKTEVKMCYDDSMLYIAFICNDPDIWTSYTKRDEFLWKEEAVEVFIEVDDVIETYVEIEVSPANVLFDSYIVDPENIDVPATAEFDLSGIKTAVSVDGTLNMRDDVDNSWIVEIAIPFNDLTTEKNKHISSNTDFKINFYRLDENKNMDPAGYAWSPTGARFHKPSVFGKLIFK